MRVFVRCLALLILLVPSVGFAQSLKAYKEKLFSYPKALERSENDAFVRFDYRVERDIDDRDEIRGAKVKSFYISMRGRKGQENLSLQLGNRKIDYARTGKVRGAKWIVVYLHGRGGDRRQGISDWNFGGNFNRLKNLSVRNNGLYVVPSITNFEEQGARDVAALLNHYASQAPKAKLILACGSMGGQICWQFMAGKVPTPPLAGVIMLATFADNKFLASPYLTSSIKPLPLIFGHGTLDGAFEWQKTKALFDSIKVAKPDYPVRMRLFNTGKHGTPIRMIDWRREINWILSNN